MKKRLARLLAALLCISLLAVAAPLSNAAAPCEFALSSASVHAHARTVPLTLSIKTDAAIARTQFTIVLPEGLSLMDASNMADGLSFVYADTFSLNEPNPLNDVTVCYSNADAPISGEVKLATLVILLPEDKKTGDSFKLTLKFEDGATVDASGNEVESASVSGKITVDRDIVYGDVNCDCAVNAKDVTTLMKRLINAEITQFFDIVASDVNRDANVNAKDVTTLMKYLTGSSSIRLEHQDITEIIEEPTCQKTGQARLTCTICGDSVVVTLPITDHEYELGVCKYCGTKHPDYPVIVYTDFLKRNGELQDNLRGFALYKSEQMAQYKLFESNICDSKSGALVLYGVASFDNGLMCYVSIEFAHVDEKYTLHYDAFYKNKSLGSALGTLGGDMTVAFDEVSDIADSKVESHRKIAQSVANNLLAYTESLLKASLLGVTLEDFGLTK